jgi:hypothetical protein
VAGRPLLCACLVQALQGPVEYTLSNVFDEYGWSDLDILDGLGRLGAILEAWELGVEPPLRFGSLDNPRVFAPTRVEDVAALILRDIAHNESSNLEFKQSLILDVNKHEKGGYAIPVCASEKVTLACLKTIAAFLNSGGGTLLVGVGDDGDIVGVCREFCLVPGSKKFDFDEWELHLRSLIESRFHDGRAIAASVRVNRAVIESKEVARVQVGGRRKLAILKGDGGDQLYIRAGNKTLLVSLAEIEDYFELKRA